MYRFIMRRVVRESRVSPSLSFDEALSLLVERVSSALIHIDMLNHTNLRNNELAMSHYYLAYSQCYLAYGHIPLFNEQVYQISADHALILFRQQQDNSPYNIRQYFNEHFSNFHQQKVEQIRDARSFSSLTDDMSEEDSRVFNLP